jgi:hypothetical protein
MSFSIDLPLARPVKEAKSLDIVYIDDATNRVVIGLGDHPSTSRAEKVLLDKVTLNLLTTIGSSDFDPQMGSFVTIIQRTANSKDTSAIQAKLSLSLNSIKDKIKAEQATQELNPTQRLLDLKLSNVYIDPTDPTNLLVEVLVVTESNEEYILTV